MGKNVTRRRSRSGIPAGRDTVNVARRPRACGPWQAVSAGTTVVGAPRPAIAMRRLWGRTSPREGGGRGSPRGRDTVNVARRPRACGPWPAVSAGTTVVGAPRPVIAMRRPWGRTSPREGGGRGSPRGCDTVNVARRPRGSGGLCEGATSRGRGNDGFLPQTPGACGDPRPESVNSRISLSPSPTPLPFGSRLSRRRRDPRWRRARRGCRGHRGCGFRSPTRAPGAP